MHLTGIKLDVEGFLQLLDKCEGITYEYEPKGAAFNIFISEINNPKPALIRAQETKDGLSLSSNLGQNKDLGEKILQWCSEQDFESCFGYCHLQHRY